MLCIMFMFLSGRRLFGASARQMLARVVVFTVIGWSNSNGVFFSSFLSFLNTVLTSIYWKLIVMQVI